MGTQPWNWVNRQGWTDTNLILWSSSVAYYTGNQSYVGLATRWVRSLLCGFNGWERNHTNNFLAMLSNIYTSSTVPASQGRKTLNHESCGWMNWQQSRSVHKIDKKFIVPLLCGHGWERNPYEPFPGDVNHTETVNKPTNFNSTIMVTQFSNHS